MAQSRMNLNMVSAVIADGDKYVLDLVTQILKGFGLERQAAFETGAAAKDYVAERGADLCVIESVLPDMSGFELVKGIRRLESEQVRVTPIIVLTGHTQVEAIAQARDCGANAVVKKPVSPQILFDRIAWVAKNERPFVEAAGYIGPDRRFKSMGPPDGVARRSTDLSAEVGDATEPNMSQDEIDALIKPMKVTAT
jgi:DNA-binding response OmpR family regulator